VAGETRTYNVVDPTAPAGERSRAIGALYAARRQPTPEEVKRINDSLAAMEKGMDPPASAAATPARSGPKAEAQTAAGLPGL
jgi:hypothetical protein